MTSIAGTARGLVVADRNALRHHGAALRRALRGRDAAWFIVPPGEASKSMVWLDRIHGALHMHQVGRDGFVLAFGGGVTGDLAGFAAATWHRGITLVMVPTTLLSQVDSSVGGKVGVNREGIKNVVGAFHQPALVVADVDLLRTLPRREFRSALAEVVKYGMIADARLLRRVEREAAELLAGQGKALSGIVAACCRIKARIVAADERDSGVREKLNYGHTLGHALEAAAVGALRHGEAVALGMRGAASLAVEVGWMAPQDRDRQNRLLDRLGLPRMVRGVEAGQVLDKLKWDKKVRDGIPRFVLTPAVGSASLAPPISTAVVRRALAQLVPASTSSPRRMSLVSDTGRRSRRNRSKG